MCGIILDLSGDVQNEGDDLRESKVDVANEDLQRRERFRVGIEFEVEGNGVSFSPGLSGTSL